MPTVTIFDGGIMTSSSSIPETLSHGVEMTSTYLPTLALGGAVVRSDGITEGRQCRNKLSFQETISVSLQTCFRLDL